MTFNFINNLLRNNVLCTLATLLLLWSTPSLGADIYRTKDTIFVKGSIAAGDFEKFKSISERANWIQLEGNDDPSQNINDKIDLLKISDLISNNELSTRISSFCTGMCANYLFLSGKTRVIESGGSVAFGEFYSDRIRTELSVFEYELTDDGNDVLGVVEKTKRLLAEIDSFDDLFIKKIGFSQTLRKQLNRLKRYSNESLYIRYTIKKTSIEYKFFPTTPRPRCLLWIPTASQLKQSGVVIQGQDQLLDMGKVTNNSNLWPEIFFVGDIYDNELVASKCSEKRISIN